MHLSCGWDTGVMAGGTPASGTRACGCQRRLLLGGGRRGGALPGPSIRRHGRYDAAAAGETGLARVLTPVVPGAPSRSSVAAGVDQDGRAGHPQLGALAVALQPPAELRQQPLPIVRAETAVQRAVVPVVAH